MSQSEESVYTISQIAIKANSYAEEKFKLNLNKKPKGGNHICPKRSEFIFMKWKNETKVFSPG